MKNTQKHININNKKNKKITKIKKMRGGDKFEVIKGTLKNLLTQIIQTKNKQQELKSNYSIIEQLTEKSIKIYVLDDIDKFVFLTKNKIKKEFDNYLLGDSNLIDIYLKNNIELESKIVYGNNNIYLVILNKLLFKALHQPSTPSTSGVSNAFSPHSVPNASSVQRASSTSGEPIASSVPNGSRASSVLGASSTSGASSVPGASGTSRAPISPRSSNLKLPNKLSFFEIAQMFRIGLPLAGEIKKILGLTTLQCMSIGNSFKNGGDQLIDKRIVQKIFEDNTKPAMPKETFISEIRSMIHKKIDNQETITPRDKKILNKILELSNNESIKKLMIERGFITDDEFEAIIRILTEAASEITKPTSAANASSANNTANAANANPASTNANPAVNANPNAAVDDNPNDAVVHVNPAASTNPVVNPNDAVVPVNPAASTNPAVNPNAAVNPNPNAAVNPNPNAAVVGGYKKIITKKSNKKTKKLKKGIKK